MNITTFFMKPNPFFASLKKPTSPKEQREKEARLRYCRALGYSHPSELHPDYKPFPR